MPMNNQARSNKTAGSENQRRRDIPAVEKVLQALGEVDLPRPAVVAIVRRELAALRSEKKAPGALAAQSPVPSSGSDSSRRPARREWTAPAGLDRDTSRATAEAPAPHRGRWHRPPRVSRPRG